MASATRSRLYDLVICGGGTGGCALAHKFTRYLGAGRVCVIEPADKHYYQPIFTLVGAGIKQFEKTHRSMSSVLPSRAAWLRDRVAKFEPDQNTLTTASGEKVEYKHLVIAIGLELKFDRVKGLAEALLEDPQVCSNYSPVYVNKTFPAMQRLAKTGGNAIFTFPTAPIKCPGAPQKIAYLTDDYLRNIGKRSQVSLIYATTLPSIFGVKRYADSLNEICNKRDIQVNTKTLLVEVDHNRRSAVLEHMESKVRRTLPYAFLHASPPQQVPPPLKAAVGTKLVNADGFVDLDPFTLHHKHYPNVWAVGDCTSLPNSKTAAAACVEAGVIEKHLKAAFSGAPTPSAYYTGYASCPLVTSHNKCILAEFGYDGKIMETTPLNQSKEARYAYLLKADFMPWLYWHFIIKGFWEGPAFIRKLLHLGFEPSSPSPSPNPSPAAPAPATTPAPAAKPPAPVAARA